MNTNPQALVTDRLRNELKRAHAIAQQYLLPRLTLRSQDSKTVAQFLNQLDPDTLQAPSLQTAFNRIEAFIAKKISLENPGTLYKLLLPVYNNCINIMLDTSDNKKSEQTWSYNLKLASLAFKQLKTQKITTSPPSTQGLSFNQLLNLCNEVARQTQKKIPYASNKNNRGEHLSDPVGEQFHRDFALRISRASKHNLNLFEPRYPLKRIATEALLFFKLGRDAASEEQFLFADKYVKLMTDSQYSLRTLSHRLGKQPRGWKEYHHDNTPTSNLERFETDVKNAHRFAIGNCAEHSASNLMGLIEATQYKDAFPSIANLGSQIQIEKVVMKEPLDHAFVVVNRQTNSDPNELGTWGPHAIIIDTWFGDGAYSLAEQMKAYLEEPSSCLASMTFLIHHSALIGFVEQERFILGQGHSKRWQTKHEGEELFSPPKPK